MLKMGQAKKVTIYVGEDHKYHSTSTYAAILDFLFYRGVAGANVVRGMAGFGADHHMRMPQVRAPGRRARSRGHEMSWETAAPTRTANAAVDSRDYAFACLLRSPRALPADFPRPEGTEEFLLGLFLPLERSSPASSWNALAGK